MGCQYRVDDQGIACCPDDVNNKGACERVGLQNPLSLDNKPIFLNSSTCIINVKFLMNNHAASISRLQSIRLCLYYIFPNDFLLIKI